MPFYFQLSELLEQEVVAGRYEPGIRPPSEPEISSRYGLSRTTVRQALSALITGAVAAPPRSSSYTTGAVWAADGGLTAI